jgi:predicted PurR-regulated permease PerM
VTSADPGASDRLLNLSVDVALRLGVMAFMIGLCVVIVRPFVVLILWAIILAVSLSTAFDKLASILGRRGLAAAALSLSAILLIGGAAYVTGTSLIDSVQNIRERLEVGTLEVPPPNEALRRVPRVGESLYDAWEAAHDDVQQAVVQFEPQLRSAGRWAIDFLRGVGGAGLQTLVSLIIASVLLTYREGALRNARAVARRIAPEGGEEYVAMTGATINSVTQGVLGVAAAQAIAGGIVFVLFGVPFAGLLALILFVTAVIQVPGLLIMALPIAWGVSNLGGAKMVAMIVSCLVVAVADAPLKAALLGRGVPIPTFVILIGALGGMVSMGMMGLFIGAVVLGLAYRLLMIWTGQVTLEEVEASPEDPEVAPA